MLVKYRFNSYWHHFYNQMAKLIFFNDVNIKKALGSSLKKSNYYLYIKSHAFSNLKIVLNIPD